MNEIDRLRAARDATPPPSAEVMAQARARVTAALESDTAQRPRRGRRWTLALTPVAALAVAVVLIVVLQGESSREPAPSRTAPAPGVAAAPAADKVVYRADRFTHLSMKLGPPGDQSPPHDRSLPGAKRVFRVVRLITTESWIAPDGSGEYRMGPDGPWRPHGPQDRRAYEEAGSPDLGKLLGEKQPEYGPTVQQYAAGQMEPSYLSAGVLPENLRLADVPTEVEALRRWLRERAGADDQELQVAAATVLRWPLTPPGLRRALVEVLVSESKATQRPDFADAEGRRGLAIVFPGDGPDGLNLLVVDPETFEPLGEGELTGEDVQWHQTFAVKSGAVEEIGDRLAP